MKKRRVLAIIAAAALLLIAGLWFRRSVQGGVVAARGTPPSPAARESTVTTSVRSSPPSAPIPKAPLETVPQPSEDRPLFAWSYRRVLRRFTKAEHSGHESFPSRFQMELESRRTDIRLLTLAFPGLMEEQCLAVLENSKADHDERGMALCALGLLTVQGRKKSEGALYKVAVAGENEVVQDIAAGYLGMCDRDGRYRSLYLALAGKGGQFSFEALARQQDPETSKYLQDLAGADITSRPDLIGPRHSAKIALNRLSMLQAPDRDDQLMSVLEGVSRPKDLPWVLKMTAVTTLPGAMEVMRRRLDQAEGEMKLSFSQFAAARPQASDLPTFETSFRKEGVLEGMSDGYFDDILVAYHEAGGKVTALEKDRLTYFGYISSRQRLAELLSKEE
jgi:hypothetical protein